MATSDKADLFREEPLTYTTHMDHSKHYIGESLPVASLSELATTIGTVTSTGVSPIPARADHTHKIDSSMAYASGDIKFGIWTDPGTGWLLLNGATIVGGQTLYPSLWAVIPAGWKSGADIVLPNMNSRFPIGTYATLGAVAGPNTVTLTEANLAVHDHTLSAHTHTITHTHTIAHVHDHTHTHTIAHTHTTFNTASAGTHAHTGDHALHATVGSASSCVKLPGAGTGATITDVSGAHLHSIAVPTHSGSSGNPSVLGTDGSSAANTGASSAASTGGPSTANTGNAGSGTAFSIVSAHLEVNFAIKT